MQNIIKLPQEIYNSSLKEIHGVAFSAREIEVIGAILLEIPTQQIPDSLPITEEPAQESIIFGYKVSERTIASHIDKIYEKLSPLREEYKDALRNKITKRDKIKYVIQNSIVSKAFEEYCRALKIENAFLNQLEKIFRKQLHYIQAQIDKKQVIIGQCQIYYWKENSHFNLPLYMSFAKHLNDRKNKNESKIITTTLKEGNLEEREKTSINYLFYIIPEEAKTYLNLKESKIINVILDLEKKVSVGSCKIIFLLDDWKDKKQIPEPIERLGYIHFRGQENYYESFFEVLKKMFPNLYLCIDDEIKTFKKFCLSLDPQDSPYSRRKILLTICLLCLSIFLIGLWGYINFNNKKFVIRSDLIIPTESSFLSRPELITQIDNKLNNQTGVQTVALVGPGGAGKTTISRQYAHGKKSSIIWEINAETQENLRSSFENLAQTIAKTEEDKSALREIQDVKNLEVKERKIIQFVKEHLLVHSNWLLIFDNVERFSDIRKYFPQDFETWGYGKIILTTRNKNLENNKHINGIIQIGELTPDQKAKLFMKITNHGNDKSIATSQVKELKAFLEYIPSFPLDVSVAAYYLKTTHLPYATYLENLSKYNKVFESVQENLLKEAGDYTKTRYGIISMSIQHLINTERSFQDLLLFISLLDSQNIPRNLLCSYKESSIIDKFIYSLKKYSFIIQENQDSVLGFTFSLHRSTQALILESLVRNTEKPQENPLQSLADTLNAYIAKIIRNEDFPMMKAIALHCERFLSHKNLLSDSIQGAIGGRLGSIYYYQGNFIAAKEVIEKSLDSLRDREKESYISIAFNFLYLGNVYRSLGDLEKARSLLKQSVMLYTKYGKNDEGFPKALGFLGFLYREAGNYKEAERLLKQSLSLNIQHFSANSIPAAWSSAHLAMTYREIEDYTKAKEFFEKSLLAYKNKGQDYVGVAWILAHLGLVYKETKDFRKAKELLNQSLVIYKKHFSDNHLYINQVCSYLGQILIELGDYNKAEIILLKSLSFYEKNGGKVSNDMGRIFISLGKLYLIKGNLRKSGEFFKKALEIYKTRTHPDLYRALENLAELTLKDSELLKNKGQVQQANTLQKEAADYLKQALQITKAHFSEGSPHIVRIEAKLKKFPKEAE